MTRTERFGWFFAPGYVLWRRECAEHAETRRQLKAATTDLEAHRLHLAVAVEQRRQVMTAYRRTKRVAADAERMVGELRCQLASLLNRHVLGDPYDEPGAAWAAHRAISRAVVLLDTHRWDAV